MTVASTRSHPNSERESIYESLTANYRPPVHLRKNHKDYLKTAWSILAGYDGKELPCDFCNKVKEFAEITIHHKDGNEQHNTIENVCPACWECNDKEKWIVRRRKKAEVSERERDTFRTHRELAPDAPDSMKKNLDYEEPYRTLIVRLILNAGLDESTNHPPIDILKEEILDPTNANAAACEETGANPKTGFPYLDKMKNPTNGFMEVAKHPTGIKYLRFRKKEYYSMSESEIIKLHPKTGQRTSGLFTKPIAFLGQEKEQAIAK